MLSGDGAVDHPVVRGPEELRQVDEEDPKAEGDQQARQEGALEHPADDRPVHHYAEYEHDGGNQGRAEHGIKAHPGIHPVAGVMASMTKAPWAKLTMPITP